MEKCRHTPLEEYLMQRVNKIESGCWEWTGPVSKNTGYGKFVHSKKHYTPHRASYTVFKGEIPKGQHICHSCDNRICFNPDHLWAGSAKDNMQDMIKKGRAPDRTGWMPSKEHLKKLQAGRKNNHPGKQGSKHHLAKLDEEKVKEIKIMMRDGYKNNEIADIYKVCTSNISLIRSGKRWSHVNT